MNMGIKSLCISVILGLFVLRGQAAPFQNLDFSQANIENVVWEMGFNYGPIQEVLPGWQVSYKDYLDWPETVLTKIGYDDILVSPGFIGLFTRENYRWAPQPPGTLQGSHILVMGFWEFPDSTYTLKQRGDVPEGVGRIYVESEVAGGQAKIYMNGTFVGVGTGDISAFAGQKDVELTLVIFRPGETVNWAYIDRVQFIKSNPEQPWLQIYYFGGWPQLRVLGAPGVDYVVETSRNETRNWTPFAAFKSWGIDYFYIPTDGVANRFFRARKAP